jgi:DNA modification methylase
MGSGMLPPNAYVTLEHEYILIFRKGKPQRSFEAGADQRYNAAYFWEERNKWFSDVWMDIRGEFQSLDNDDLRDRSAAYPFEIPYRLINMYSVYGDTVLDPFWGTGTTSLAALTSARNSVGYEIEKEFTQVFDNRISEASDISRDVTGKRLKKHREFVESKLESGDYFKYEADNYDFPVTTKQEKKIQFYVVDNVKEVGGGYRAGYSRMKPIKTERETVKSSGGSTSLEDF